jgi:hypothetical protein
MEDNVRELFKDCGVVHKIVFPPLDGTQMHRGKTTDTKEREKLHHHLATPVQRD